MVSRVKHVERALFITSLMLFGGIEQQLVPLHVVVDSGNGSETIPVLEDEGTTLTFELSFKFSLKHQQEIHPLHLTQIGHHHSHHNCHKMLISHHQHPYHHYQHQVTFLLLLQQVNALPHLEVCHLLQLIKLLHHAIILNQKIIIL